MNFLTRLLGRGKPSVPRSVSHSTPVANSADENLDEMIDAALTLKAYKNKGWFEVLRDGNGKFSGFWLGHPLSPEREQSFVKAAAVSEDLDQDTFIPISFGDYRIVPNDHEIKGGHFVMIGTARAPTESVLPLGSFRWRKGDLNPASKQVARFRYGNVLSGVKFLCPIQRSYFQCKVQRIRSRL